MSGRLLAALAILALSVRAHAVLPPQAYEEAAKNAMHKLEVRVLRVEPPPKTPGTCTVHGEIAWILWDKTGRLRLGRKLSFGVSCRKAGESIPAGGTLWTDWDALARARYVEAHLNSDGDRFAVALDQVRVIPRKTSPHCRRCSAGGASGAAIWIVALVVLAARRRCR